jgi:hypothetical protein
MQSLILFFRRTPSFGGCVNSIADIQCRRGYRLLRPRQIIAPIFVTLLAPILFAESIAVSPITVDATSPYLDPAPSSFQSESARSPDGHTIGLNQRYLTLDGKPWLPVMGEFHFSRVPADEWEDQILKMQAAGVNIIATYVIWIHHEEIEGKFNWTGDRDLRRFAQLCAKHHMYLYARVGPWAHGEARNGGFPDWLIAKGPTRVNDPTYLKYVTDFYGLSGSSSTTFSGKTVALSSASSSKMNTPIAPQTVEKHTYSSSNSSLSPADSMCHSIA